jgi:hypothetical protein
MFGGAAGAHAAQLCGRVFVSDAVDSIRREVAGTAGMRQILDSQDYVAFEERERRTVWTFVKPEHPAAPAVVCRRSQPSGIQLEVQMQIICGGQQSACNAVLDKLARQ